MIISKITPKIMNLPAFVRRSREWHGVSRKEGTGARFVPEGGGKKVLRFHGK